MNAASLILVWVANPGFGLMADWIASRLTAMSVLVAVFSGQGPTNFLVDLREALLSSKASGKHYWYSKINERLTSGIYLMCTVWYHKMDKGFISMFNSYFARLLLRILKTNSTKLGRFRPKITCRSG